MPTVSLEGLEVKFPYDPYEIQKDLMSCVIKCIQNREHGLLESPTGTGKTASLLCASLAWLQNEKEVVRRSLQGASNPGFNARGQTDPSSLAFMTLTRVPKIIYATRTHSQISQAMRELKRTSYNRVKAVILGSRDILCIHDEVSRLAESSTKNMACHMRVLGRTCAYYNNVQKMKEQMSIGAGNQPVMDIEELVSKGRSHRFCPFFMSKEMVADADIIFMPYNYMLDPKLRAAHGVDLKSCIIILDEAHNITKVCEDSSSFELKSSVIAQCLREITKCLNEFNELTEDLKKNAKDLSMGEIVKLKSTLLDLEKELDNAPFCLDIPDSGKTVEGAEVLRCFFASGFTIDQFGRWIRVLDGVSSFLASNYTEATGCDKFSGVLRVLSTRLLSGHPGLFLSSYTVKVEWETKTHGPGPSNTLTSFQKTKGKLFNFWCLNPAVGLDLLLTHNPRCIMLASGTLSPIEFLENELQMHFPVKIQNPHIITEKQLYAAVLKVGPGDVKLSSAFNNRGKTDYLVSLGSVIKESCAIVPEGVLVFFPSYSAMDQAVDYWKNNGLWGNIAAEKSVYVEPRGKRGLDELMANYYTDAARGSGSCLMAVCRGKVSEGLDFTDGKCRAVIITGLPYAPFKNEQVTSKMKYLDSKANQSQGVRGSVWYSIDAVRALNQAVGRIIRHKNDFGAILLCDDRCDYKDVNHNLSTWVSSRLVKPTFTDMIGQLAKFFQSYGASSMSSSGYSQSYSRLSQSQVAAGSSFIYSSQSNGRSSSSQLNEEYPEEAPEPEVLDLYDAGDDVEEIPQVRKKSSGGLGSALARLQQQSTAAPIRTFTASVKSLGTTKPASCSGTSVAGGNNDTCGNPKKKIKLVAGSKFSRVVENHKYTGLPRSGETIHHVLSSASRMQMKSEPRKTPLFKPLFSSTQSPAKKFDPKNFENVKEYGEWVKSKLDSDKYKQIMQEFKNYKVKNEVMKLLDFGKKIFPDSSDYKSYLNGLRLVTTIADRAIINDVILAYEDLDC